MFFKALGEESVGSTEYAVTDSLKLMESMKPGFCEIFVSRLLERLGRFNPSKCEPYFFILFYLPVAFVNSC